jgi:hypothetical protein
MSAAIRFRHQDGYILSDRLGRTEAKQPFGRRAEGLHDAVFVDHDHRVRHSLKDGLQVCFTRSQRTFHSLRLVDVEKHTPHARGMTLVVEENAASLAEPTDFSGGRRRPVVELKLAARSGAHLHCVR